MLQVNHSLCYLKKRSSPRTVCRPRPCSCPALALAFSRASKEQLYPLETPYAAMAFYGRVVAYPSLTKSVLRRSSSLGLGWLFFGVVLFRFFCRNRFFGFISLGLFWSGRGLICDATGLRRENKLFCTASISSRICPNLKQRFRLLVRPERVEIQLYDKVVPKKQEASFLPVPTKGFFSGHLPVSEPLNYCLGYLSESV